MIIFKEMCWRVYFYVQSEQLESKWRLALAGDESLSCFLCDNNQNISIHHNTKYLWLYCKWFKLRLLTFNAYFSKTRSIRLLSPESVDGCGYAAVLVIMPYISPIDVGNKPRHPWAVCSHDGHVLCLWRYGEWTDGWLIICRALQPWAFGGPTCWKCCVEKRTQPRIYMAIKRFLCTIFSF